MTVLIKYPKQTEKRNKVFFEKKDKELTDLDWSTWGGWFVTDGSLHPKSKSKNILNMSKYSSKCELELKDKQPVELFSKIFECSLKCREMKTTAPNGKNYRTTTFASALHGEKARWFTKNIYPYLIKQGKKDYAAKLLGYRPESKDFADWTADEIRNYLATASEGDGRYRVSGKKTKSIEIGLASNDVQYLSDVQKLVNKLGVTSQIAKHGTYKMKKGIRTMYVLNFLCSRRNPNNLGFFQSLVKDGVMTLDRKKQKVQEFVGQAWVAK